ncbi:alpha beta-hydrolase [Micractinium conductrix]|uniref:Alpha beta-hydrolase n=1 Tax=Micractinium conductrix TaxID=554055 RepID=A0A2P6VPK9_9CHLO|nr:alpha beta-hydrolase [Micractinium conductrix]|eukprot:PSC76020.1 alpha beta-hydrolase [Micractinium conductrix]
MYTSEGTGIRRAPSALLEWCRANGVECLAVQPPGRLLRGREPPFTRCCDIAEALLPVVASKLIDTPYVVIAHSVGTWVAYELLRLAAAQRLPMPRQAFLSAMASPDIPHVARPWRQQRGLGEEEFKDECRSWDVNEIVFSAALWGTYHDLMRADFTLFDEFEHTHGGAPPFAFPVTAFYGNRDRRIKRSMVEGWQRFTTGSFQLLEVDGHHLWPLDKDSLLGELQRERQQQQQQQGGVPDLSATRRTYHFIDSRWPGLEQVHAEPPVYIAHDFLSADDCAALRRAAEAGQLPYLAYDNAVLVDTHRLLLLLPVVAAGAGFDAWQALLAHSGAGGGGDAAVTAAALAAAAGPALLHWSAGVGLLVAAALGGMRAFVGGRVFTGTKWTAAQLDPSHPAAPAFARFLSRTSVLLGAPADRLEPPTVTRYRRGEYQRKHFDARPDGDPAGLKQFLEAGGQRLVQVVVYLNEVEGGGGTRFHHPLFRGLTIEPRQGDALLFFPAYADGRFDVRMAHSGQPVEAGQKFILNTWCCQRAVPSAASHLLDQQGGDASGRTLGVGAPR